MVYQVLTRRSGVAQWRCVTPPTGDLRRAQAHLHTARRYNAGAALVAAESLSELARLTQRLREAGEDHEEGQAWAQASAPPLRADTHALDPAGQRHSADRRWELECGPGGDHDAPYSFAAPASEATRRAWARLLARVQHERRDAVWGLLAF